MIDFVKLQIINTDCNVLELNPLLNFTQKVNTSTAEIVPDVTKNNKTTYTKIATYKNLKFKICNDRSIYVSGSLHKYFNNGEHNYNLFSVKDLQTVLIDIQAKFNVDLDNCILKCLEVGVNVQIQHDVDTVLHNVIMHRKVLFEAKYLNTNGHYKQCMHSDYIVKIYNKTKQYRALKYNVEDNTLRFEIKYRKMRKVNDIGFYSLKDLLVKDVSVFNNVLINEFDNIFIYDFTHQFHQYKNFKLRYSSINFWRELLPTIKSDTYKYHLKKYQSTIRIFKTNLKNTLKNDIENGLVLIHQNPPISPFIYSVKTGGATTCILTGLNIEMQRKNSTMLSHTGLRYYLKNEPETYKRIKNRYLSIKWCNEDTETQIKEIAHNIRTRVKNQIWKYRTYNPKQMNLLN